MPKKIKKAFPLIIGLILLLAIIAIASSGLFFNTTDSMPIGFYYRTSDTAHIKAGTLVTVKLPEKIQDYGIMRGYVKDSKTELIKKVIAVPGDNVILTKDCILVNGKRYSAVMHKLDPHKRKVKHIRRGEYRNTGGYWIYGSNNIEKSWDSRYFGPVQLKNITGVAKPVIIF